MNAPAPAFADPHVAAVSATAAQAVVSAEQSTSIHDAQDPSPLPKAVQTQIETLLKSDRFAEACQLFEALPDHVPDIAWHARTGLHIARRRKDHAATLHHAERLRSAVPDSPVGYGAAIVAYRAEGRIAEAAALVEQGLHACPNAPGLLEEAARVAEANNQDNLADERWAALRRLHPTLPTGALGGIRLSVRRQRPQQTSALLADALGRFPANKQVLQAAARHAASLRQWADASAHWDSLIALSPDDPAVAVAAAHALIGPPRGRPKRLAVILERLAKLHGRFPDYAPGFALYLDILREAGRLEDAATFSAVCAERFPADPSIAIARCRVEESRGRLPQALTLAQVAATTASAPAVEANLIRVLRLLDRTEEADDICQAALGRNPNHSALLSEHIAVAIRRGDYAEALARAKQAVRLAPSDRQFERLVKKAHAHLLGHETAAQPVSSVPLAPVAPHFISRFESLGAATGGCEFGLLQRKLGIEQLGLLKWSNIPLNGLIAALQARFEGMGVAENTELTQRRISADNHEYGLADRRYGYWSHTFIKVDEISPERMLTQSLRRLAFLRNKLLEDLETGDKVFVYKHLDQLESNDLRRLFTALRSFGPVTFLLTTAADDIHPRGTLAMHAPGLFIGYVGASADGTHSQEHSVDADEWLVLCERVANWHADRPAFTDLVLSSH